MGRWRGPWILRCGASSQTFQALEKRTQCDSGSEEDILVSSGELASFAGLVGKQALKGTLCLVGGPASNNHGLWTVLCAGEVAEVSIALKNVVRGAPSDVACCRTRSGNIGFWCTAFPHAFGIALALRVI